MSSGRFQCRKNPSKHALLLTFRSHRAEPTAQVFQGAVPSSASQLRQAKCKLWSVHASRCKSWPKTRSNTVLKTPTKDRLLIIVRPHTEFSRAGAGTKEAPPGCIDAFTAASACNSASTVQVSLVGLYR